MFGISELAIVLIAVAVLFGAKKLPELARSMGKSARILKSEARAMKAGDGTGPGGGAAEPPAPRTIRAAPGDVISRSDGEPGSGTART
ncbi:MULTISPECIES: twin-arginine translocase TatA/TatE family subunit [Streptomyces]|uniref:twin-arginine translocase TatA/TatE family subunit n=1 Tax=Streptomyces TaxID=1883 RepID=UPI001D13BC14|nr:MULTISPECIES: twin-arginine translocase TatA/TatE family subunit [Streptomyces]MCC3651918.1 twin-arginine translocase TatA/TatE family subunit [Streptomyces sp. S07_1.15]WSQ73355.1 twin-arginine translocase TatA/TatE family subunit [Streptomyces xinghaiensis]